MAQPKEFLPLITTNPRIARVYGPSTVPNIEYTLPATTVTQYESFTVTDDPNVRRVVHDNLRVIILPQTYFRLLPAARADVTVMSSPFECGRVLEADPTVMIDGVEYTVNIKGVGATSVFRNGEIAFENNTAVLNRLAVYPFYHGFGELDARYAQSERDNAIDLRAQGIDTEKVLGIYRILRMPGVDGEYTSPAVLKQENRLSTEPTLLVRASKSHFRLLDSVTMYERQMQFYIPGLRELILEQFHKAEGQPGDMDTYLRYLTQKLFRQEVPLITQGYEMSAGKTKWKNLARNVSVLGEELDLEAVEPHKDYLSQSVPFDYKDHVTNHVMNIDKALRGFADTITDGGPKVDFDSLALMVWEGLRGSLANLDLHAVLRTMTQNVRRQFNFTGPDSLFKGIFDAIEYAYIHMVFTDTYRTPPPEGGWIYRKTMVDQIAKEKKALFK